MERKNSKYMSFWIFLHLQDKNPEVINIPNNTGDTPLHKQKFFFRKPRFQQKGLHRRDNKIVPGLGKELPVRNNGHIL